jgi:hypothetical protein
MGPNGPGIIVFKPHKLPPPKLGHFPQNATFRTILATFCGFKTSRKALFLLKEARKKGR